MAADEGLAKSIASATPILRVYRWQPFAISIGYNQNPAEIDFERCLRDGVEVVRRPTGGRAIFHAHEVTYSVVIPKAHGWFAKPSLAVYNDISSALVLGLQIAELPVTLQKREQPDGDFSGYRRQFACFASSARHEIHYQTKKLVGSAQRRFENALLQHGSILIGPQHLNLIEYLANHQNGQIESARGQLKTKTICIEEILGREISFAEISTCVAAGFKKHLTIELEATPLNASELQIISQLEDNYSELWRR